MNFLTFILNKNKLRIMDELAFGAYNGCERCEISYLTNGWDCVCDLLIEAGNCPKCLNIPSYCRCEHRPVVLGVMKLVIPSIPTDDSDFPSTPIGYKRVVHRYRTEFVPLGHPVAYTPGF